MSNVLEKMLKKEGVTEPEKRIMELMVRDYAEQVSTAMGNDFPGVVSWAYHQAARIPTDEVLAAISNETRISLSRHIAGHGGFGQMFDKDKPEIIVGTDENGAQLVIKVLRLNMTSSTRMPIEEYFFKLNSFEKEVEIVTFLELSSCELNLVPVRAVNIKTANNTLKPFDVLVMPRFISTVNVAPKFSHQNIVKNGRALISAVEYMHSKGVVHCDIKDTNVFVNQAGDWFLGDFDSARYVTDEHVDSTTEAFYFKSTLGLKPHVKYDWYMLCVMLCVLSLERKISWVKEFGSPVKDASVRAYVNGLEETSPELREVMLNLLERHDNA